MGTASLQLCFGKAAIVRPRAQPRDDTIAKRRKEGQRTRSGQPDKNKTWVEKQKTSSVKCQFNAPNKKDKEMTHSWCMMRRVFKDNALEVQNVQ